MSKVTIDSIPDLSGKRVLVHSLYFHPELTGISKYSGEMVNWLVANGAECTVVTAFPFYPYWEIQKPYKNLFFKKEVFDNKQRIIYRCPLYVPRKPTGLKRVVHDASFLFSSFFIFFRLLFKKKFDLIISVAPPFHLGFPALFYRFFKGSKTLYHIQDLQVDMARELDMLPSKKLLDLLEYLEKYILKKMDFVSTISQGMKAKIGMKVSREIIHFPNWADISQFYPLTDKSSLKKEWGFKGNEKIVMYSGNLGEKQGLDQILDIAKGFSLKADVKFVICGSGAYKEVLVNRASNERIDNVVFLPLQSSDVFNKFLNMADVHLILQKKDASDLVMPSKLTSILAVGGIVIATAQEGTDLFSVLRNNKIGFVVEPENQQVLAREITKVLDFDNSQISEQARAYALQNISMETVMPRFFEIFF